MARKEPLATSGRRQTHRHLWVLDPFLADVPSQGTPDDLLDNYQGLTGGQAECWGFPCPWHSSSFQNIRLQHIEQKL